MKICFFSDIHGNGYAFDAFLKEMEKQKPDKIIFGGDFAGYYYDADRIISKMRELRFICVLGNHDKMLLELLDGERTAEPLIERYGSSYKKLAEEIQKENDKFLRELPLHYEMDADGLKLGFFHGSPRDYQNDRIYPDTEITDKEELKLFGKYDYVFSGHTHHKLIKQFGKTTLINPGSAGQQRDGKGTSYVLFDTKLREWEICSFAYDIESLERDIDIFEGGNEAGKVKLKEVLRREAGNNRK